MSKSHPIKTFVLQLLRAIFAALTVILISRWIGAEGRGELSLVLFAVNLIIIANEFIGGSNLANLAARQPLNRLVPFSMLWAFLVCTIGCIVYYMITARLQLSIVLFSISLPLSWLTIHYNLYHGLQRIHTRNKLQLLLELSRFLAVIAMVYWVALNARTAGNSNLEAGEKLQSIQILWMYAISVTGVLFISTIIIWPGFLQSFRGNKRPLKLLITSGFWNQNGQLVQFLNYRLNLVLLTFILGEKMHAGIYSNALLIADSIWIFGNSFASIAHMRMLQSENATFRADITLRYAVISVIGTFLGCAVIFIIPNTFYIYVFGSDFVKLKETAMMLSPAILALGASTLFSHYLHATNQFKFLLIANMSGLLLQVVMAIFLIPGSGLFGAVLAANAGFIFIFLVVYFRFRKQNPNAHLHGKFHWKSIWQTLTRADLG